MKRHHRDAENEETTEKMLLFGIPLAPRGRGVIREVSSAVSSSSVSPW
jgi:hypothetical protein